MSMDVCEISRGGGNLEGAASGIELSVEELSQSKSSMNAISSGIELLSALSVSAEGDDLAPFLTGAASAQGSLTVFGTLGSTNVSDFAASLLNPRPAVASAKFVHGGLAAFGTIGSTSVSDFSNATRSASSDPMRCSALSTKCLPNPSRRARASAELSSSAKRQARR